ncbi:molybdopterin converting factor subunit 1 [Bacillus benzoevorans]|uniref:Molybdopterin synthase sulfur carrier subunit n=1 Tax=Bacillus benzoevorans TaxID=1456 RepID=A0A7X0HRC9_9BACI|nr:molybdopterin converting factor subunit 1 [Bacillus benzoevorans]MBB6445518.1 molybdopterin synthase sulfur carrier subunit [Bacillus benzoevorans]
MSKILFFAHLRDAVGQDSVEMDVSGKSVAEVKQIVSETYGLQKLETVMVAINEEFATDSEVIQEGDTIAFIPPVSGG